MKKWTLVLPLVLALLLSGYSTADELTDAATELCDAIKTCALEAVAGANLSAEVRQMIEPVLQSNCAAITNQVVSVPASNPLYQSAVGCMRSMASLGCPNLQNASQFKTAECAEYDKAASKWIGQTP
jgi:hypothetical protein